MANIKQQKKRIGTAQRQRMQNLRYRSTTKTLFNRLQLAVDTGDTEAAASTHRELVRLIDRSVTRGALHRNTASRKKARAARMLLQEAKTDAATTRKAKKKTTPVRKPKVDAAAKKPAAKKAPAKKPAAAKTAPAKPEAAEEPTDVADEAPVADDATAVDETAAVEDAPAKVADEADAAEAKD